MFYGSITGNEWNTTADNQPFTVRQSFPTVFTLSDPYRNLPGGVGPFPFDYDPASPRFTLPAQVFGPSLDFVWPFAYQMNLTVEKEIVRAVSVSARRTSARSDATCPAASIATIRCSGRARRRRTSTRGGRTCRGRSARRACSSRSSTATITGCRLSAERRGARLSAKAYYTFGKALEDVDYQGGGLPAVQNSNRIELERGRTSSRSHAQPSRCRAIWNVNYLGDTSGAMARALLNGWTVSAIITLQSGTPLTIGAGQDRNFDGLTNDRADLVGDPELDRGRPREELIEEWFSTRRLRAAGGRHRRQRRPQHRRRPGREERRLRPVPRHPAWRPRATAAASRRRRTCSTSST